MRLISILMAGLSLCIGAGVSAESLPKPKLIVVVVFDQFRADYLTRFERYFLPAKTKNQVGGFSYLMKTGAYYPYGQYDILQSMTGPGHATILSGSYPYQLGIPTNEWFDSTERKQIYCTADSKYPLLGGDEKYAAEGGAPTHSLATTVGDELKNAGLPSKVVAIALKDRAAILLGGHRADLALWHSDKSDQWVSSTFYFKDGKLPGWVVELNQTLKAKSGNTLEWQAQKLETGYEHTSIGKIGSTDGFPKKVKVGEYHAMTMPYGVEITVTAAEKAIDAYQLGRHAATDLLAISFSSHDYLGHEFGPNSPELEQMTIFEDRQVSRLLNTINKKVPGGLANTVVVLTGDHGVAPLPEYLAENRIPAKRYAPAELRDVIEQRLTSKFGKPSKGQWVIWSKDYSFNLDRDVIADRGKNLGEVEEEAKKALLEVPGILTAFSESDYQSRTLPPGQFQRQIMHTFVPGRSGDVIAIPKPFYLHSKDHAGHMTGYNYDRTVPLILAGKGFRPGIYAQKAEIVDLAPTLTFITGVVPPAMSEGRVLSEALLSTH